MTHALSIRRAPVNVVRVAATIYDPREPSRPIADVFEAHRAPMLAAAPVLLDDLLSLLRLAENPELIRHPVGVCAVAQVRRNLQNLLGVSP